MDLFEANRQARLRQHGPLASRMRPATLDEFVGQESILAPGSVLRRAIERDRLSSIILWGPPGVGKTTLARLIATQTKAHFVPVSAVSSGVADLRALSGPGPPLPSPRKFLKGARSQRPATLRGQGGCR